jgi:hypothetical protein
MMVLFERKTPAEWEAHMKDILDGTDVMALAKILTAVQNGSKIRRLIGDNTHSGVVRGFVVDEDGTPGVHGHDIRDLFLRVAQLSGTDAHWPVRKLVKEVNSGAATFDEP